MAGSEYYDHTTYPAAGAAGSSAAMRSELNSVEGGFDKLIDLSGNANTLMKVNAGESAHTASIITDDGSTATVTGALEVTGAITQGGQSVLDAADIGVSVQAYDATYLVDADIGSTVQGYDAGLAAIAALAVTDGNIIVGNGTSWTAESGATARTSLGAAASGANSDITSLSGLTGTGTLDTYEVGTFTPYLEDQSKSGAESSTYNQQDGKYTRIGDLVFFQIYLRVASLGALTGTDYAYIGGLPYSVSSTNGDGSAFVGYAVNLSITAGQSVSGSMVPTHDRIWLYLWDSSGGQTQMTINEVTSSAYIKISGWYYTDA